MPTYMSNWELFQTAYQNASQELCDLVDSEKIPTCVEVSLGRRNGIHLQSAVTAQMSYQLIGAQTIDATVAALLKLGISDGLQFIVEVQNCLQQPQSTPSGPLASEISQTEKSLESLQTVRTMPHDMATIKPGSDVVYQSSQADILRTPTPAAPATAPEAPRWETEG
jgi:hypothetical protein